MRFRIFLREKYNVKKAFIFIGYLKQNQKLYQALKEYGFELIFKNVLEVKNDKKKLIKGNVDAELVLHTMINYKKYDKAIIVSGDGDFYCLIEYLERKSKLLKIITPNKHYSSLIRKYARQIVDLSFLKKKLEYKDKK